MNTVEIDLSNGECVKFTGEIEIELLEDVQLKSCNPKDVAHTYRPILPAGKIRLGTIVQLLEDRPTDVVDVFTNVRINPSRIEIMITSYPDRMRSRRISTWSATVSRDKFLLPSEKNRTWLFVVSGLITLASVASVFWSLR